MNLEDVEQLLRERLDALGPAPRAELLRVLMLPDYDRPGVIGEYWANPKTRTFAELLIDAEESRRVRAVPLGVRRVPPLRVGASPENTTGPNGQDANGPRRAGMA